MKIYHYHPTTGELMGEGQADPHPLEQGAWLLPAWSTETPPPDVPAGQAAVFRGGAWALVTDQRGRSYWTASGERREILELGQAVPADATEIEPLAVRQAAAWERIKAERDRRSQQGGYQVAGKWFHSDTFSRTQQLGLIMLGTNLPAGLQWKTMDGSFVAMTPALAQQVFAAAAASDIAIFAAAETHRAAMQQAAEPETYSFAEGWPPVYPAAQGAQA